MRRRPAAWPILVGLMLLAAALRIAAIGLTGAVNAPPEENRLIAANLAGGRGFSFNEFGQTGPTAVRGPTYPMLLALIGHDRVRMILAVNVAAGALSVLAAFVLVRRLSSPPPLEGEGEHTSRAAWAAAVLFAVWPTQVFAATLTQGISVAAMLTLTALSLAWRRPPGFVLAGGLLAGLAALTEPSLAVALLLVAVVIGWRHHWADAALFVGAAMVLVAPWLYRNSVVFGRPMAITSNVWRDAFLGNGDDATGSRNIAPPTTVPDGYRNKSFSRLEALSPIDYDRLKVSEPRRTELFRTWATTWIAGHPTAYLKLCVVRAAEAFFFDPSHASSANKVFVVSRWLLALACLSTLVILGGNHRVVIVLLIGVMAAGTFTVMESRLSLLMDVPQLLVAAAALKPGKADA